MRWERTNSRAAARRPKPLVRHPIAAANALLVIWLLLNGPTGDRPVSAEVVDKIVAVVNEEVITQAEVDRAAAPLYRQLQTIEDEAEFNRKLEEVHRQVLHQLIENKLLLQEVKKRQMTVADWEIEGEIAALKEEFEDEPAFQRQLEADGLTLSELKKMYQEQLVVRKLILIEVRSKITVTPSEVAAYYEAHRDEFREPERVRVSNIFIRVQGDKEAARAKGGEVLAALKAGQPFAEVATASSEGSNAESGGELGVVERGHMMAHIDEVIFQLPPGGLSDLIETETGFHIFLVEEHLPARMRSLEDVKDAIEDRLFRERYTSALQKWLAKLKSQAYVSVQ